jgi:lipoyl-dependent peroxiredoxin
MALKSRAEATWSGSLTEGSGSVSARSSSKFSDVPVSWASRTEAHAGRTSPEELLAAAHASCYAMALSAGLGRQGHPPERLDVSATVTFDKVGDGFKVTTSELTVRGKVPGVDAETFRQAAEAAKDGCPISGALKGNVELSVEATLES